MAGVATTCDECEGKRSAASVLTTFGGGIAEVLDLPVAGRWPSSRRPGGLPCAKILDRLTWARLPPALGRP